MWSWQSIKALWEIWTSFSLQDEEEEERENEEALATGEKFVIPGQPGLTLPTKKK